MADGAQRVTLADAGQTEGEHIGRVGEEVALRKLVELAHQRRRQAALIEGRKRLARRKLRRAPEARGAAVASLLRFELQHLEEERQRRLLLGGAKRETSSRATVVSWKAVSSAVI